MNGAESLARTLLACEVDTCFANPGTSEMHFVSALDRVPQLRCILGLAETVVTGCADGYARMAGKPSATLLHCGPGLANGWSSLHNARRANAPIVNVVGDHATWHRPYDPVLASDIEGLAHTVSAWVRTSRDAASVGSDAAEAVAASLAAPGNIATLILPADTAWNEGGVVAAKQAPPATARVEDATLDRVAAMLRKPGAATIMLGGAGLLAEGLRIAHRIAAATGARLLTPTQVPRMARGRSHPPVDRLPFPIDSALRMLAGTQRLVLAGARPPVGFFGYPGKPSELWPKDCEVTVLAKPEEDIVGALTALAERLGATKDSPIAAVAPAPRPSGRFTPEGFGHAFASVLPDDAVVVEDAVTSGRGIFPLTFAAAPHDWLQITGGSIGFAFPAATGAAVGAPGRKVVCLQADGGGMYSLQSLWTQARERLDVVNVIFNNKRYAILQGELANVGAKPGPASNELFDISRPDLDWVGLAKGMGVEAVRADDLETFMDVFAAACKRQGPFLIEMMV